MIYLDNAATTFPKPQDVYEKTFSFLRESAGNPGRGSHHFAVSSAEIVDAARREVARLFGVRDPRRVIFTYNCTDSINMVLKGYLKPGDHVIATNLDHNSVSRPLENLRAHRQVQITRAAFSGSRAIDPQEVRQSLRDNTTLVVLNHGSNVFGTVQDLAPFLDAGVPILLDAAQTAGRIPIELGTHRVFLACSAHKSLYGMPGLGILIVPENTQLMSWREGGSGTASEVLEHPEELPMHLEAGTPNFLSIAALLHGIAFIQKEGMSKIHETEWKCARRIFDFLQSDDRFEVYSRLKEGDLAVIAFQVKNAPPEEVAAILDQRFGIAVRAGLHCAAVLHQQLGTVPDGCLRASPGYFNTEDEIDRFTDALKQIADAYS